MPVAGEEDTMSYLSPEQNSELVRILGTLKCVAMYDFVADDGEVYYLSDYEMGQGKHLHVCLLNVPDSEFRIAPLRYLSVQPHSSWYVHDTKIDTESEIGSQMADTMRAWLNSNPWKEYTSFDSDTGRRLQYGVDKIKRYACCGCAVGSHTKNPEQSEDHKDSLARGTAGPSVPGTDQPHLSNAEGGEAGFAASANEKGGYPNPNNSTGKEKEIPQSPKSPLHNGVHNPSAEHNSQQAMGGSNAIFTNVNGISEYSPATMGFQARQDRQRICTIIDASLKARGYFAMPDIVDAAYDAGFRTCTDAEGFGEWCKLWKIPRNLPEASSDTKEAHQSTDASHGSVPQGMMLINMDLVPLEHRDFVAQWCKPVPATTPNGGTPSTSETSNVGQRSSATNDQSKTAQKRAFEIDPDGDHHDTTSNKKRIRSCGEMSLYQSCYSRPTHPVQPYGDNTPPEVDTSNSSKELPQAQKRAKQKPRSPANKSRSSSSEAARSGPSEPNNAGNLSKSKANQGVKRKKEEDHDGFRNSVGPKYESSSTSNKRSRFDEEGFFGTPYSPATKFGSSSRANSPTKSENAGIPLGSQETHGVKRKNSNEHPRVLHNHIVDLFDEDEVEEANIKASPDVLKTRKIASPSRDLDKI